MDDSKVGQTCYADRRRSRTVWIAGWFALIGWVLWHGVPLLWP